MKAVFRTPTDHDARALAEALALHGRARFSGFAEVVDASAAAWSPAAGGAYELAPLDPADAAALHDAFAPLGRAPRDLQLVRHRAGHEGLPPVQEVGFVLDLSPDWPSGDGGLLLFVDEHGRVEGWRPEAGALTLYDAARPPLLTMVAPHASRARLAVAGSLHPR